MKKSIFTIMFFFSTIICFSQNTTISIKNNSYVFGHINESDGIVSHDFYIQNTGSSPLIIKDIRTNCSCTSAEWIKRPIMHNDKVKITIFYDPTDRPGNFIQSIAVFSNTYPSTHSLTIRGIVTSDGQKIYNGYDYQVGNIQLSSCDVDFGVVLNDQIVEKDIKFVNSSMNSCEISIDNKKYNYLKINTSQKQINPNSTGILKIFYNGKERKDWGYLSTSLNLSVKDLKTNITSVGEINLTSYIMENFSSYRGDFSKAPIIKVDDDECDLGEIEEGETQTYRFSIYNIGKSNLVIHKINIIGESIKLNSIKRIIKPGKKIKIVIHQKNNSNYGKNLSQIEFMTNDPKHSILTYQIKYISVKK